MACVQNQQKNGLNSLVPQKLRPTLYALITEQCNLSCYHCDVKKAAHYSTHEKFNEQLFIQRIKQFNGDIILFGGEPTLYLTRMEAAIATGKVTAISTNLLILNEELLGLYKDLRIATSWDVERFRYPKQLSTWQNNLQLLANYGLTCSVIVTLTRPLLQRHVPTIAGFIKRLEQCKAVTNVQFEYLLDANLPHGYYTNVEEWLVEMHEAWQEKDIQIENTIVRKPWYYDCDAVFTLYPNGQSKKGCPHQQQQYYAPDECYVCDKVTVCKPCQFHQVCSRPNKLFSALESENAR